MKNLKYTKTFIFDYAQYKLADRQGDQIILKIDYAKNKHAIKSLTKTIHLRFRKEASKIARDLLKRKHKVNFANR